MAMSDDLRAAILRLIGSHEGPIGQGAIGLELRSQGWTLSIPTIGRRLQEMEFEGLIRKVGVQGRILSERGEDALEQYNAESILRASGNALLKSLNRGDRKHLLDLLAARRVLEGEAAALAAQHATPQLIRRLERHLKEQEASIGRLEAGVKEDVIFHNEIARASRNSVLMSIIALLRQHHRYNLVITSIRSAVGGRLVVDHSAIVEAIRAKDPARAREAMDEHLVKLANDLNRYWKRVQAGTSRAAGAK
jgi:GntR family L-lactate dehydrogenase operon transcriptional regulator